MSVADRVGIAIAIVACLIAFVVGSWGLFGPIGEGHYASDAAIGMAADNMWRLHTRLPVIGYQPQSSTSASYYMHHPMGVFWVTALLGRLFGFHDWVTRFPALLYVTATTAFVYLIGRELGKVARRPGGAGVREPADHLGFATLHDLEQPRVMLGCLVATWGYLRTCAPGASDTQSSAWPCAFAAVNDWQAYMLGGLHAGRPVRAGYLVARALARAPGARRFGATGPALRRCRGHPGARVLCAE